VLGGPPPPPTDEGKTGHVLVLLEGVQGTTCGDGAMVGWEIVGIGKILKHFYIVKFTLCSCVLNVCS
jgi:hypothetical protein